MPSKELPRISVSFRVSRRFKRCLELAAEHDQRSQTNLVEKLVFDYCKSVGIEPETQTRPATVRKNRKA